MQKQAIIKYWNNVRALTLDLLDLFPEHEFGFRPKLEMRSVAEQFDHILAVELYIRNGLKTNIWDAKPATQLGHIEKKSLKTALVWEHENTADVLRMLPDGAFEQLYTAKFGSVTGEGLIYLAIDEEIHHRGNLYVYLRLLDIKPPQMVQKYSELFTED
jgi:uncharacterized damage-inducible protein DinB